MLDTTTWRYPLIFLISALSTASADAQSPDATLYVFNICRDKPAACNIFPTEIANANFNAELVASLKTGENSSVRKREDKKFNLCRFLPELCDLSAASAAKPDLNQAAISSQLTLLKSGGQQDFNICRLVPEWCMPSEIVIKSVIFMKDGAQ